MAYTVEGLEILRRLMFSYSNHAPIYKLGGLWNWRSLPVDLTNAAKLIQF